jgi:hypothetical protein
MRQSVWGTPLPVSIADELLEALTYETLPAILGKDAISIEYPWNEPESICVPNGGDLGTLNCTTSSALMVQVSRSTATAQVP